MMAYRIQFLIHISLYMPQLQLFFHKVMQVDHQAPQLPDMLVEN